MPGRRRNKGPRGDPLFELPPEVPPEPEIKSLVHPIWTENKAKLIDRYLFYFVMVTKHGTYMDAFAGPQKPDKPEMWAAKLVLESEPRRLRHFYLFEESKRKVSLLENLKAAQAETKPERTIEIVPGDCNVEIPRLLEPRPIREKEACFCLLDQRTFECRWETVERLARYKTEGMKIELFYFFAVYWLARALSAVKNKKIIRDWWGRDDWAKLKALNRDERTELLVKRFRDDLGYKSVKPWPIFSRKTGGSIMYHMIHATDHPEAPKLMARAYERAVLSKEPVEQLALELGS